MRPAGEELRTPQDLHVYESKASGNGAGEQRGGRETKEKGNLKETPGSYVEETRDNSFYPVIIYKEI